MPKFKQILLPAVISTSWLVVMSSGVATASPTISKAYNAQESIQSGSIVRLIPGIKNTVDVANLAKASDLVGITASNKSSLLEINPSNNTVQVVVSGEANALVSTINGNIRQGDLVAVSPFGGMGMESSTGDSDIGVALSSFNSQSPGAKKQSVTDTAGHSSSVWVGEIPINIAIGTNEGDSVTKLNGLQRLAESITGHVIPTVRVVAALVLSVLAFATLVTLTYAATYSGIISIGRNPLAKGSILRGLLMIGLALVVIALVAGLLVYLLLS